MGVVPLSLIDLTFNIGNLYTNETIIMEQIKYNSDKTEMIRLFLTPLFFAVLFHLRIFIRLYLINQEMKYYLFLIIIVTINIYNVYINITGPLA